MCGFQSLLMTEDSTDQQRIAELEKEVSSLRGMVDAVSAVRRDSLMRFAAGFSHDVNNLLTPVIAYAMMIKEDAPPGHPVVEYAQEILDAGEKAQQLIKLIQDIRAKGTLSGSVDLNETVAAAAADLRSHLPSNIALTTRFDPAISSVRGEGQALSRAMKEIFDNAVLAMPAGGDIEVSTHIESLDEPATMEGDTVPAGRYGVISICDQGAGISADQLPKIFDPYFTGRPQGNSKGLGLAIAHGLVRKCGGGIRCTSSLGAGAKFEIFLSLPG